MAKTTLSGKQITDNSIQRVDLDITTVGSAVIAKIVQGTGITISSTGADSGTGDVTINATGGGSIASTTSVLKGNGSGGAIAAVAGTDFAAAVDPLFYALIFG